MNQVPQHAAAQPADPLGQVSAVSFTGAVAQQIGSGENAHNAIVYKTILWCFIAGGALSAAAFAHAWYKDSATPMNGVKDVWAIFAPMVTLALGYMFGKGK